MHGGSRRCLQLHGPHELLARGLSGRHEGSAWKGLGPEGRLARCWAGGAGAGSRGRARRRRVRALGRGLSAGEAGEVERLVVLEGAVPEVLGRAAGGLAARALLRQGEAELWRAARLEGPGALGRPHRPRERRVADALVVVLAPLAGGASFPQQHPDVLRPDLHQELSRLRPPWEGEHDVDLLLGLAPTASQVRHVPSVHVALADLRERLLGGPRCDLSPFAWAARPHHLQRHVHDFFLRCPALWASTALENHRQVPFRRLHFNAPQRSHVDDQLADLLLRHFVRACPLEGLVKHCESILSSVCRCKGGGPADPGFQVLGQKAAGLCCVIDGTLVGIEPQEGQGAVGVHERAKGFQGLGAALGQFLAAGERPELVAIHWGRPIHLKELCHGAGMLQCPIVLSDCVPVLHALHGRIALLLVLHGIVLHGLQDGLLLKLVAGPEACDAAALRAMLGTHRLQTLGGAAVDGHRLHGRSAGSRAGRLEDQGWVAAP
mmetsp:Transcript_120805/g.375482  ORF Transcript_120805/g.375482 Transcript_120805/m.375482 type:complete len:492 (-) Transcript_120805:4-1479(-)